MKKLLINYHTLINCNNIDFQAFGLNNSIFFNLDLDLDNYKKLESLDLPMTLPKSIIINNLDYVNITNISICNITDGFKLLTVNFWFAYYDLINLDFNINRLDNDLLNAHILENII